MSIKNIGKSKWLVTVTQRIPGKPNKTKKKVFHGSRAQAQDLEHEFRVELRAVAEDHKRSLKSRNIEFKTFGQCLEYFLETRSVKKMSCINRLQEHLTKSPLTLEIGVRSLWDDLLEFREYMLSEGFPPSTTNRHTVQAQAIVTHAFKNRKISYNFLRGFGQLRENNKTYRILTNNEKYRLFKELPEHLKPLVYTAMRIPTRISELLMLTNEHISEDCMMITLREGETKGDAGRWLPIFPEMKPFFESVKRSGRKYVFTRDGVHALGQLNSRDETYQLPKHQYHLFNDACERAEIEGYNFHKTRQQAAMQFLYDGFTEKETMKIGGWLTMEAFNRYAQVDDVLLKKKLGIFTDDDSWKQDLAPKPI